MRRRVKEKELTRVPSNAYDVYFYGKPTRWEKALYQMGYKYGIEAGKAEVRKVLGIT